MTNDEFEDFETRINRIFTEFAAALQSLNEMLKRSEVMEQSKTRSRQMNDPRFSRGKGGKLRWRRE